MSKYNYYTPIELAALLLELIPQKASISSAIDICCGSWNLLAAAKRHYPEVKIKYSGNYPSKSRAVCYLCI